MIFVECMIFAFMSHQHNKKLNRDRIIRAHTRQLKTYEPRTLVPTNRMQVVPINRMQDSLHSIFTRPWMQAPHGDSATRLFREKAPALPQPERSSSEGQRQGQRQDKKRQRKSNWPEQRKQWLVKNEWLLQELNSKIVPVGKMKLLGTSFDHNLFTTIPWLPKTSLTADSEDPFDSMAVEVDPLDEDPFDHDRSF